jgi:RNA polymerase sigma-70 factor (ECF subfamily)
MRPYDKKIGRLNFFEFFLSYKRRREATNAMNDELQETQPGPVDDAGLRAALERHHAMSYGWALSCCSSNPTDAEDILQTVYQKILEGRARYDGRAAFKTWLFAVIRNTAASERRRSWIRFLRLGGYQKEHEKDFQSADDGVALEGAERIELFRATLGRLPRRQREILHLVFYQDLTVEAAAKAMGVSLGSARTHYDRAKKQFAQLLKLNEAFHD